MAKIEIYTTLICPYCEKAKILLRNKGVSYEEIDVSTNAAKRHEMTERSNGHRTVPQIFINGEFIGGSDDLHELDKLGKLDAMIKN